MHSSAFGTPQDPVCEWLYGWALHEQSGQHPRPGAMARFVARCVPLMLTQALLRTQPLPGLDVRMMTVMQCIVYLGVLCMW